MPEKSQHRKSSPGVGPPDFDFYGMSGAGRQIGRTPDTARAYAKQLRAAGCAGIFKISNGDFVCDERGIAALRAEAAARAARKPGG